MDIESYRQYCMRKPGVTEGLPFDQNTLVFKVMGKMFALTDLDQFTSINLKCDPEQAVELREKFEGVTAGYHMNKKHWNTILCDGSVDDKLILAWTDDSYQLVIEGLSKKQKEELKTIN